MPQYPWQNPMLVNPRLEFPRMTYWPRKMIRRCTTQYLMKSIVYFAALLFTVIIMLVYFFPHSSHTIFHFHMCDTISPAGRECVDPEAQDTVDYMARHLKVQYTVLNNVEWNNEPTLLTYHSRLTLHNSGYRSITNLIPWSIYFSHVSLILRTSESELLMTRVNVTHVNADLHRLQPTILFGTLAASSSLVVPLESKNCMIARSDGMPNWYVHMDRANPRIIESTRDQTFVSDFESPKQWKRILNDTYNPFTPKERYMRNMASNTASADDSGTKTRLIPTPLEMGHTRGLLKLDASKWVIAAPPSLKNEADALSAITGIQVVQACARKQCISLDVNQLKLPLSYAKHSAEAYHIEMTSSPAAIKLTGGGNAGVFYAVQTLTSLINNKLSTLPVVDITDAPRFNYRGFMLDVSRNFFPVSDILNLLDLLSLYKLNKLHLHLTDDPGWRLQIPGIPELTEFGARRGHDPTEKFSLMPSLGSGPFYNTSGSGYYTVEEYRQILRYAKKLHIEIIPEFDFPGHSYAAIHSMDVRYRRYQNRADKPTKVYQLQEDADHSEYRSVQLIKNNALNPCLMSTYLFIRDIMLAVIKMHQDISPLRVFHFGGDEVPTNAHELSPTCLTYNTSVTDIYKTTFVKKILKVASKHNVTLQGWGDAFYKHHKDEPGVVVKHKSSSVLHAQCWKTDDAAAMTNAFANAGYRVILSHASHLYFDHPQEPDPEERGLYWATRYIDTARAFSYRPQNIYENLDVDRFGQPYPEDMCRENTINFSTACIQLRKPQNIIGMEAALWTETVRTRPQLDAMLFPRLLALAERSWHQAKWEKMPRDTAQKRQRADKVRDVDWHAFATHLGTHELLRLGQLGVKYYLPPPGVRTDGDAVSVNTAFPGLPVQISADGGVSWKDWKPDMKLIGHLLFATRSFDWKRRSRSIVVNIK